MGIYQIPIKGDARQWRDRAVTAIALIVCVVALILFASIPSDSLVIGLTYRGF
jgi:hypothetical protein